MTQSQTHIPATLHRLTVLLADDGGAGHRRRDEVAEWHGIVADLLRPQGVRTVSARSGTEALERMEASEQSGGDRIHVAVLSEQMPRLGALQVLRLARDLPHAPPAILLTPKLNPRLLHDAIGMSVFSVLTEPVDLNILLDTLARVLKRYHEGRWPE